jgi:hypothetical protein
VVPWKPGTSCDVHGFSAMLTYLAIMPWGPCGTDFLARRLLTPLGARSAGLRAGRVLVLFFLEKGGISGVRICLSLCSSSSLTAPRHPSWTLIIILHRLVYQYQ